MDRKAARDSAASPPPRGALAAMRIFVALAAALEALSLSLAAPAAVLGMILGYAAYTASLYLRARGSAGLQLWTAWVDAAWLLVFAWLIDTPGNLFVILMLFPVLGATVGGGRAAGLLISLIDAAILLALAAPRAAPAPPDLMQPLAVLTLGALVAVFSRATSDGGAIDTATRRLVADADPRLGVGRLAEHLLTALGHRLDADFGLLLVRLAETEARVFRVDRGGHVSEPGGELRALLLDALAALPSDVACTDCVIHLFRRIELRLHRGFTVTDGRPSSAARYAVERLADAIDARSLVVVPFGPRSPHPCHLVFESGTRRFGIRVVRELAATMERAAPLIENAGLLERLSDEAAAAERARIGLDLHDCAIQPYLGLKYAIDALALKAGADNPLRPDVQALKDVAVRELHELRELVADLRSGDDPVEDAVDHALRRQAKRFSELFGIDVSVRCDAPLALDRKVSGAVLAIVGEALTNVRRHTEARHAEVAVEKRDDGWILRITNAHDPERPPAAFVPRSIAARAQSFAGRAVVERRDAGFTDLIVSLPR